MFKQVNNKPLQCMGSPLQCSECSQTHPTGCPPKHQRCGPCWWPAAERVGKWALCEKINKKAEMTKFHMKTEINRFQRALLMNTNLHTLAEGSEI